MGPQGPIPATPASLREELVARVSATNPDFTANLPGSLIEDIVSTDIAAVVMANQFFVDLVNSVTPYGANPFILNQLGNIYGVQPAQATNTAVDVIFIGTPGFIIIPGFTVSDGNNQYICTEGGVIGVNEQSLPIHAVASRPGTWSVPSGSVDQLITSVPGSIQLYCINPTDGIPSTATETESSYRTRCLTAGLAASTGMDRYLKTLLWNIPGVVQRLVSVRQNVETNQYAIIVGGGDPYQVAWAIYYALFAIPILEDPQIEIDNITNTNPMVIQTVNNHQLVNGMIETLDNIEGGMSVLNGMQFRVTVTTPNTFSIPYNGHTLAPYTSGGTVSPNPIVQKVSLNSYPDTYIIPFILPAQQYVTLVVNWKTNSPNYVSEAAIAQAAAPALEDYVNSLYVGISPISIYDMTQVFMNAIDNLVSSEYITVLNFAVSFDGVGQVVEPGTGVIYGDHNSYFYTTINDISIVGTL